MSQLVSSTQQPNREVRSLLKRIAFGGASARRCPHAAQQNASEFGHHSRKQPLKGGNNSGSKLSCVHCHHHVFPSHKRCGIPFPKFIHVCILLGSTRVIPSLIQGLPSACRSPQWPWVYISYANPRASISKSL